jgi:hypothetical protein
VLPDVEVAVAARGRAAQLAARRERRGPPELLLRRVLRLPDLHRRTRPVARGVLGPRRRHSKGGRRGRRLGAAVVVGPGGADGRHGELPGAPTRAAPAQDGWETAGGIRGRRRARGLNWLRGAAVSAAAKPAGRSPFLAGD